jgi:hypothetical protein
MNPNENNNGDPAAANNNGILPADSFSKDALEFFDAMEAIYIENMLHEEQSLSDTPSVDSPTVSSEFENAAASSSSSSAPISKVNERTSIVHNLKGRVDAKQKKLRQLAHAQRIKLENQVRARRKRLERLMKNPKVVMTMDKISFVLGLLTIMLIEGVLLCAPDQMGLLYTVMLVPLMVARYIIYKADFMHYFMYDFCYFSQVLLLLVSKVPECLFYVVSTNDRTNHSSFSTCTNILRASH